MNITLGSLRTKDILALEDLDLLPENADSREFVIPTSETKEGVTTDADVAESAIIPKENDGGVRTSRSGMSGGISWFEDMIEGSKLGRHSKRRKGQGTSADGTTTVSWEISEYYDAAEDPEEQATGIKRKADNIESDDTTMKY